MTQTAQIGPSEPEADAIADYRQQARIFLNHSWDYLAQDDLHQASEKGWAAAAWMAKAVAEAQGWPYNRHGEFFRVMRLSVELSGNARLVDVWPAANLLHEFFYTRKLFLDPELVQERLYQVVELLDILQPLTELQAAAD